MSTRCQGGFQTAVEIMASDTTLQQTADALLPLLYPDLRRLARRARWRVSAGPTIQTTARVHETYLNLCSSFQPGLLRRVMATVASKPARSIAAEPGSGTALTVSR